VIIRRRPEFSVPLQGRGIVFDYEPCKRFTLNVKEPRSVDTPRINSAAFVLTAISGSVIFSLIID
jgi:hypothetical protein